jgi:hypothetical protein
MGDGERTKYINNEVDWTGLAWTGTSIVVAHYSTNYSLLVVQSLGRIDSSGHSFLNGTQGRRHNPKGKRSTRRDESYVPSNPPTHTIFYYYYYYYYSILSFVNTYIHTCYYTILC